MRGKKLIIYCEVCGTDALSGTTNFIAFHQLSFCSPDCLEEYRLAEEQRRAAKEQPAGRVQASKAA